MVNVIMKLLFIDSYTLDRILIKLGIRFVEKDLKYFLALIGINFYIVIVVIELTHYTIKFIKELVNE